MGKNNVCTLCEKILPNSIDIHNACHNYKAIPVECGHCHYYEMSFCHRNAMTIEGFPQVDVHEWCGEFELDHNSREQENGLDA